MRGSGREVETSGGTFADIDGATSATYMPRVDDDPSTEDEDETDVGYFLSGDGDLQRQGSQMDDDEGNNR